MEQSRQPSFVGGFSGDRRAFAANGRRRLAARNIFAIVVLSAIRREGDEGTGLLARENSVILAIRGVEGEISGPTRRGVRGWQSFATCRTSTLGGQAEGITVESPRNRPSAGQSLLRRYRISGGSERFTLSWSAGGARAAPRDDGRWRPRVWTGSLRDPGQSSRATRGGSGAEAGRRRGERRDREDAHRRAEPGAKGGINVRPHFPEWPRRGADSAV